MGQVQKRSRRRLWIGGVGLVGLGLGIGAGAGIGSLTLRERFIQRADPLLRETFQQPVTWGELQGVGLGGITLGPTYIGPADSDLGTPTSTESASPTADPALTVHLEGLRLGLDWAALRRGNLRPVVTLMAPTVTLPQADDGHWLLPDGDAEIVARSVEISSPATPAELRLYNGTVVLRPAPRPIAGTNPHQAIALTHLHGVLTLTAGNASFSLTGQIAGDQGDQEMGNQNNSGQFELAGHRLGDRTTARLSTQQLPLAPLNLGLPSLAATAGTLHSSLTVQHQAGSSPELWGTAILQNAQIQIDQLRQPLTAPHSTLLFQGQQVQIAPTLLHLGPLTLTAEGTASRPGGYALSAHLPPLAVADMQDLARVPLPSAPGTGPLTLAMTGPLDEPQLAISTAHHPTEADHLGPLSIALGASTLGLPLRHPIPLVEGATYSFRADGAWFTLADGTVVPPLSATAYAQAQARYASAVQPGLDRKFFWFLQTSPYLTAIAADLEQGRLRGYVQGQRFNTDAFFLERFMPAYAASSAAAGLDPAEALWMLNHSLRTLQDPLLKGPDAAPITSGSGAVGSFWQGEQALSMQQLVVRRYLGQRGQPGDWVRFGLLAKIDASLTTVHRQLTSSTEAMTKVSKVTFGAEEGAIAHALAILRFPAGQVYGAPLREMAQAIAANEAQKQALRQQITADLIQISRDHSPDLAPTLARWLAAEGDALSPATAAHLNGSNTLSVMVDRYEKAGYPLDLAHRHSRQLLQRWLQAGPDAGLAVGPEVGGEVDLDLGIAMDPERYQNLVFALLKDYSFRSRLWHHLGRHHPALRPQFRAVAANLATYRHLAEEGAVLHEQLYRAMVTEGHDIGVDAAIHHAVGFQAHLSALLDQALQPPDPADPRYRAFRRSLAMYLREAPDIATYGGRQAPLRLYGQEMLNLPELIALEGGAAPRLEALAQLYREARQANLVAEWDRVGFQRILLLGALLAAGAERENLPPDLAAVGWPSDPFRERLLTVVGGNGIRAEATRLGVQSHDYRVPFQPIPLAGYRVPPFAGADPARCPSQPTFAALALGAEATFAWAPDRQQVVLHRSEVVCLLDPQWQQLVFPALLAAVPIVHSPEGARYLQQQLHLAQQLEAGL